MRFRLKLTLAMLCLVSVLFATGSSLLISQSFQESLKREQQSAYARYQAVLGLLTVVNRANPSLDYEGLSLVLSQMPESTASWEALRLYSSAGDIFTEGVWSAPDALLHTPGYCSIGIWGQHFLTVSGTLMAGDETLYLDLLFDISPLFDTRSSHIQVYQRVYLLLLGLCALLSYSMAWVLTRPLSELSRASRCISGGELSRRARIQSSDEIGLVARDFNSMADTVEHTIYQLQDAMERQTRFMGAFAHEVKTPMTSIIGYADLIRSVHLEPEELAEAATFILAEGRRLERLSQKLLQLQMLQNEGVQLVPASPRSLVLALCARYQGPYASCGIELRCHCAHGTCLLEPDLVRALVVNLWDNARKAMPDGGEIETRTQMTRDGCRIEVVDTGPGIPEEALSHLTEAFYRVDKSRSRALGGTGLGLSLCAEIAEAHHGTIHFENRPSGGTRVLVILRGGVPPCD